MTGSTQLAPFGRMIRVGTLPLGVGTLSSSMTASGLLISPDWTWSTTSRPFCGPRSNRYGGLAVAAANSCAAGSSTASAMDLVAMEAPFWSGWQTCLDCDEEHA